MAEMYTQLAACRAFTYNTIRAAERDDLTNHDCASLLLFVSEAATKKVNKINRNLSKLERYRQKHEKQHVCV